MKYSIDENTVIVIDGENVYEKILQDTIHKAAKAKIIFMVGRNQIIHAPASFNVSVVRCTSVGHNHGDFLLFAILAREIIVNKDKSKFMLISNDKGYDSAIDYFKISGIPVERLDIDGFMQLLDEEVDREFVVKAPEIKVEPVAIVDKPKIIEKPKVIEPVKPVKPIKPESSKPKNSNRYQIRSIELSKLISQPVDIVDKYPGCFIPTCGYILKHFKSGNKYSDVFETIKRVYGSAGVECLNILIKIEMLKVKGRYRQIYFSKELYSNIVELSNSKYGGYKNVKNR